MHFTTPIVSIIVPIFNRGHILHETVDSVLQQSFDNWELILVDDGSTDDTVAIVRSLSKLDPRISFTTRPSELEKGANACRNFGLSISRGKYIKWIDSDDLMHMDNLKKQVSIIEESGCQAVFSQSIYFEESLQNLRSPWSRKVFSNDIIWDYVRNQIRWHTGSVLWCRSFFLEWPFLNSLKNSQEWLMHGSQLLRLLPDRFVITEDVIYFVRLGDNRMSSSRSAKYFINQAKSRANFLIAYLKYGKSLLVTVELVKQIVIYSFHALVRMPMNSK